MNRYLAVALIAFGMAVVPSHAQMLPVGRPTQRLMLGDPAPKLQIADWVKGEAVDLSKGKGKNVYLIEFWATWCVPCIQSIPHLTELQKQYKDKNLVVLAITDEPQGVVERFVRQNGAGMGYTVARDDATKTSSAYMFASGQMGVPVSFIITKEGLIAWIGHPFAGMDHVLVEVIEGKFDIEKAKAEIAADEKFSKTRYLELLMALENRDWKKALKIANEVADPNNPVSKQLRTLVLDGVAWRVLTDDRPDKKFFKEALYLAKTAYDVTEGRDPSVLYTYARALYEDGQIPEAIKHQRRAVELSEGLFKLELQQTLKKYEAAAKSKL